MTDPETRDQCLIDVEEAICNMAGVLECLSAAYDNLDDDDPEREALGEHIYVLDGHTEELASMVRSWGTTDG